MDADKLSLRKVYLWVIAGFWVTAVVITAAIFLLTESVAALLLGLIYAVLTGVWFTVFAYFMRKKLTTFSQSLCRTLDGMMRGGIEPQKINEEETLFAKINYRLNRLYETMKENNRCVAEDRAALQELISDISHQVKTPMADLKIVNATLLAHDMPEERRNAFLQAMSGQLDKLDFLMQAMIKMSRLETGIITLTQKECSIYETLAAALGGILLSAEGKHIHVQVDCPEDMTVNHDAKWTAEALFNILDNAVKYTASGGTIFVTVAAWEMYAKIDITDTGKGIAERRHAEVFKRFYREEEVRDVEGIGIGLYLAREIITRQGGYIKLTSETGSGSTFSVFLPN